MRKISTLAFLAFFSCLSAMAEVVLGDIKFSIADGSKLNPMTGKITVSFPNVAGVDGLDQTAERIGVHALCQVCVESGLCFLC